MFRSWILAATAVLAQDVNQEHRVGQQEYLSACAACHGGAADGRCDLATTFKVVRVPELTEIAIWARKKSRAAGFWN